jgi:hypothetical protein
MHIDNKVNHGLPGLSQSYGALTDEEVLFRVARRFFVLHPITAVTFGTQQVTSSKIRYRACSRDKCETRLLYVLIFTATFKKYYVSACFQENGNTELQRLAGHPPPPHATDNLGL